MRIVCSTATARLEHQTLSFLNHSPYAHTDVKIRRRKRKSSAFNHVRWRYPGSKIVFLIYGSGRVVILGGLCEEEIRGALAWLAKELKSSICESPVVKNVVACTDVGRLPLLVNVATRLAHAGYAVSYEPELSPAVFLHLTKPKATAMLFRSGKATITGITDFAIVRHTLDEITAAVITAK